MFLATPVASALGEREHRGSSEILRTLRPWGGLSAQI